MWSLSKSSMRIYYFAERNWVKVITVTGESFYFFYEDFDDNKVSLVQENISDLTNTWFHKQMGTAVSIC